MTPIKKKLKNLNDSNRNKTKVMTRAELEKAVSEKLTKMLEAQHRHEVEKLKRKVEILRESSLKWKKTYESQSKQKKDITHVMRRYLVESKTRRVVEGPMKITRSVGLNVNPKSANTKERIRHLNSENTSESSTRLVLTNQSPTSRAVPLLNVPPPISSQSARNVQQPTTSPPVKLPVQVPLMQPSQPLETTQSFRERRPSTETIMVHPPCPGSRLVQTSTRSETRLVQISTTSPAEIGTRLVMSIQSQASGLRLDQTSTTSPPEKGTRGSSVPVTRDGQIFNTSSTPEKGTRGSSVPVTRDAQIFTWAPGHPELGTRLVQSLQSPVPRAELRHPAPMPLSPHNQTIPRPLLSVSGDGQTIKVRWTLDGNTSDNLNVASYQIYAYQETVVLPDRGLWKKVGRKISALTPPMLCSIKEMALGTRYHIAIRALDSNNRNGPFSEPASIRL